MSTPAEVLVTVGAAGRPGAVSGVGRKIAKPCCADTVYVAEVPAEEHVGAVGGHHPRAEAAADCPLLLLPKLVVGVQCPSEPSVSDWSSRW